MKRTTKKNVKKMQGRFTMLCYKVITIELQ